VAVTADLRLATMRSGPKNSGLLEPGTPITGKPARPGPHLASGVSRMYGGVHRLRRLLWGIALAGGYEIDDVGAAWSTGKALSELNADAREFGNSLTAAVGAADVGKDLAGGKLVSALDDAREHLQRNSTHLADEIEKLGDNVIRGATEAAETNNSGTDAANAHIMTLSRAVNTVFPW